MIKISMPNKFQLRIMPELRGWFLPKKGGEIHYIGGAEILPAPFSREEESKILDLLGTEEDQNARSRLIELHMVTVFMNRAGIIIMISQIFLDPLPDKTQSIFRCDCFIL